MGKHFYFLRTLQMDWPFSNKYTATEYDHHLFFSSWKTCPTQITVRQLWGSHRGWVGEIRCIWGYLWYTYLQGWFIFPTNFSWLSGGKCCITLKVSIKPVNALYKEEQVPLNPHWRQSQWSSWSWLCSLLVVRSDAILIRQLHVLLHTSYSFYIKWSINSIRRIELSILKNLLLTLMNCN